MFTGRCLILRHDKLRVVLIFTFLKKSFRATPHGLVMPRNEASPNKSSAPVLPRLSFRATPHGLSCRGTRHLPTNLPCLFIRVCHSDEGSISPFFISTGRCLILRHDKLRANFAITFLIEPHYSSITSSFNTRHSGFIAFIKATFFSLRHPLISFSLSIACSIH